MDHYPPAIDRLRPARAITAAGIGNVLEYYDFGIYGFLASVIARKFFPARNPTPKAAKVANRAAVSLLAGKNLRAITEARKP